MDKETIETMQLVVSDIQATRSKAGRLYDKVITNIGEISCFEASIIDQLQRNMNRLINVEIATNPRGFKVVRKFLSAVDQKMGEVAAPKTFTANLSVSNKEQTMYTSYAKDIFIAIFNDPQIKAAPISQIDIMKLAIELVNQAKEAFK
jgi:hypothetical protein